MEGQAWQIEMTRPLWLAALVVLPLLVFYWRRSLVHFTPRQQIVSLAVRIVLLLAIVAALCGLDVISQSKQQFVVIAVDRSSSISKEAGKQADQFIQDARAGSGENELAIVEFAASPGKVSSQEAGEPPGPEATDIAAAIELSGAVIRSGYVGRIVLLSEGNQTRGDALAAAKASAVPISTVPLPGLTPEVYVADVETPGEIRLGWPLKVEVVVQATVDGQGQLTFLKDDEKVSRQPVIVSKGENRFGFDEMISKGQSARYTARISVNTDTLAGNNEATAMVFTKPPTRVLLVEGESGSGRHLAKALGDRLIDVEASLPQHMPKTLAELESYDLVVLSNIPAESLSGQTMESLQRYVRDFGGGLIVVGGDRAFYPGNYSDTLIEKLLPLRSNNKQDKSKPALAVVLVLDRSGSMKGKSIELAKQATRRAVEQLGPRDRVGVIAFEDNSHWVSAIGPCSDKQQVFDRIATITAAGGTNMYPAIEKAFLALDDAFADLKHIIVLTDGLSHPGDFQRLAERISAAGITVSTVAIGDEAAPELLKDIAKTGNGHYYHCTDAEGVPKIFATETISAAKKGITEGSFFPQVVEQSDVLAGLDFQQAPALLGYGETLVKPGGRVILGCEAGDPLLASWQYGRGTSVAFTSDVQSRWAAAWLRWPGFPQLWAQLVRHTMRKDPFRNFVVQTNVKDDRVEVTLDAIDRDGQFVNGARIRLEVTEAEGKRREVPFAQVAPGRYAARFEAASPRACQLSIRLEEQGQPVYLARRGLTVGYCDELRIGQPDAALLSEIAESSGGTHGIAADEVFVAGEDSVPRTLPLWPYLLAAAMLIFVVDVFLKRIELGNVRQT